MEKYIGFFAGALTVVSYLPQSIKVWRTKEVKDLSFGMFVLLIAAAVTWITYGVVSKDMPVIATNVGTLAINISILVAKVKFK
ncbi:MAG TPA: SemiSWEET transporter [Longimicrobiales bacterium]|nr:SemiSWEET transporter [Longimicrobiales bacterium]